MAASIQLFNPPNIPELCADFVVVGYDGGNISVKFYKRRPKLEKEYEIGDLGQVVGPGTELQEFEGALQAALNITPLAAYHLLDGLDRLGVKNIFEAETEPSE